MEISYKTYAAYLDLVIADPTSPEVIKTIVTAYVHSVRAKLDIIGALVHDDLYESYHNTSESMLDVINDTDGFQTYGDNWMDWLKSYVDIVKEYEKRSSDVDWTPILGLGNGLLSSISIKNPSDDQLSRTIHEIVAIMNCAIGTTIVTLW